MDSAKILLIDSNKEDLDSLSSLLGEKGYNVICADSGREGVKKAAEEKFDLIITEVLLADIKAGQLCSKLRKKKAVPVIVLSSNDEANDIEDLLQKGIADYIIKPPRPSYLLSRIEMYISTKR